MINRTPVMTLRAAFLMSAAHLLFFGGVFGTFSAKAEPAPLPGAARPGASQTSSSQTKKRRHTALSKTASSKSKRKSISKTKAQTVPSSDRIKEIQSALQREGTYEGEPTGKWDDATAEAMRKYQDKKGLSPTGKIDAMSLTKLGLGSQTAGKGAPVPVASTPSAVPSSPPPSPSSSITPGAGDPPTK